MVAPLLAMLAGGAWLGGNTAYGDYRAKKKQSLLDQNIAEALGQAKQEVIPEGGISPEAYVGNEMLRNYQTPQGQSDLYRGLLSGGYSDKEALSQIGLLAPKQEQAALSPKDMFDMEQSMAKQRTTMLKPFMEQRSQAQKTMTSLEQRTGAGDLAAVISFNKALDPASVVRESEQKAVTGVAGPIERFRSLLQDVEGKGSLTDDTRAQLASLIEEIQGQQAGYANNIVQDFTGRATGYGLNPMSLRQGQLGYGPGGEPLERFSPLRAPETVLNQEQRAKMELRRRGVL